MSRDNLALRRSMAVVEAVREGRLTDLQMGVLTACEHAGEDGIPLSHPGLPRRTAEDWTEAIGPLLATAFVMKGVTNTLVLGDEGTKYLATRRDRRFACPATLIEAPPELGG